jgi:hypothetical protein
MVACPSKSVKQLPGVKNDSPAMNTPSSRLLDVFKTSIRTGLQKKTFGWQIYQGVKTPLCINHRVILTPWCIQYLRAENPWWWIHRKVKTLDWWIHCEGDYKYWTKNSWKFRKSLKAISKGTRRSWLMKKTRVENSSDTVPSKLFGVWRKYT